MKVAVLILCHKNPEQINLFLDAMQHPMFSFFILIDKKADFSNKIRCRDDVIVLPDEYRFDMQWGTISLVDATLRLLRFSHQFGCFDFFWNCSGQDFPIKHVNTIAKWFESHPDNDFIHVINRNTITPNREDCFTKRNSIYYPKCLLGKGTCKRVLKKIYIGITGGNHHTFRWAKRKPVDNLTCFFGAEWFCLSRRTLIWILSYLDTHAEFYSFMKNCICPDESFFQTLVMNSPYAKYRMDYLHHIDWSENKSSPKIFCRKDLKSLLESDKLMARKFDTSIDSEIINNLVNIQRAM